MLRSVAASACAVVMAYPPTALAYEAPSDQARDPVMMLTGNADGGTLTWTF